MDFIEFLTKQKEVYDRFRDTTKIKTEGTAPKLPDKNAYFLVYRHPDEIAIAIENISMQVSRTTPALIYTASNVHSTLSDYFPDLPEFPNQEVLDKLASGVKDSKLQRPVITYPWHSWLYNQNTVIAEGYPTSEFVDNANQVIENCKAKGIALREPWGGHITVARFKEKKSPKELEGFFRLIESINSVPPLDNSHPISLDVGYAFVSPEGIDLHTFESFPLKNYS